MTEARPDPEYERHVRDVLTAVIGLLWLADSPRFSAARRRTLRAAALRQAEALKAGAADGGLLLIVSRSRPHLHEWLRRAFARDPHVSVVLDRRQGQSPAEAANWAERRKFSIDEEIESIGIGIGRPHAERGKAPRDSAARDAR